MRHIHNEQQSNIPASLPGFRNIRSREERPDGQETMVCVRLLDTTENANLSEHPEYTIRTADQALYDAGIDEGDRVWFDPESGQIEKAAESH